MLSDDVLVAIIGLIGMVITSIGTLLMKAYVDRKYTTRREKTRVLDGLAQLHRVYLTMHEFVDQMGAERVVLFAGHNSGGVPRVHSAYWVTALHWVSQSVESHVNIRDYQNIVVDSFYISMLLEIERTGCTQLMTETMPECQLKSYYVAEGVTHSLVLFLAIKEYKLLYVSIARYTDVPFTSAEVVIAKLKANKIKNLLEISA